MSEVLIAGGGDEQTLTAAWVRLGTRAIKTLNSDKGVLYLTWNPVTNADTLHVMFKTGPDTASLCQTTAKETSSGVSSVYKEQFDYVENLGNAVDDLIQIPILLADNLLEVYVMETAGAGFGAIDLAKVLLKTNGKD